MSTLTIIQGNSNDKDNTRAYMVKGERGDDGISPTFETSKTGHTATITITDAEGTHTVTLTDGVSPTVETSKTGGVTTITITDEDGTHTATINDGQTYEVPAGAVIGFDGNTIPAGYEEVQYTSGSGIPTGSIMQFAGATAPTGFLICDGSAISRDNYSDLFDTIGTTYGTGDGSTTFNIPNLKGRVAVGKDSTQTEFDSLGETGGEKTHTLTTQEMPSHNHDITIVGIGSGSYGYNVSSLSIGSSQSEKTGNKGGDQAHNNLQPYIVLNYIIKY